MQSTIIAAIAALATAAAGISVAVYLQVSPPQATSDEATQILRKYDTQIDDYKAREKERHRREIAEMRKLSRSN